jgi:hypothetical protein
MSFLGALSAGNINVNTVLYLCCGQAMSPGPYFVTPLSIPLAPPVGPTNAGMVGLAPVYDLVSFTNYYIILLLMIYNLDAALGNPIWATADGYVHSLPSLDGVGQSHTERRLPCPAVCLSILNEPAVLAGYFGVAEACIRPGESLGRGVVNQLDGQ